MATDHNRIGQLAPEIQAQIRSSVQISSLSDVVLGLVKNSLDAHAGHIGIRLDFLKGYCSILDDGHGILKDDFIQERIGQLYFTSKNLHPQNSYGRYGRFLSSLSGVSLLYITSSHSLETSTNSITLKDGRSVAVNRDIFDEDLGPTKHGTRVVVHNLFGQIPVRVKQRHILLDSQRELDRAFATLKKSLVDLILAASQQCYFDMRDAHNRYTHRPHAWSRSETSNMLSTECIVSTMFQAGYIESADTGTWQQVSVRVPDFSLSATINLKPAPSKHFQFISLNQHPLLSILSSTWFDDINDLFDASTFSVNRNNNDSLPTQNVETAKVRKAQNRVVGRREVNRWPIFYIRIQTESATSSVFESTESRSEKFLSSVQGALRMLITEFLRSHKFGSRKPETVAKVKGRSGLSNSELSSVRPRGEPFSMIKFGTGISIDLLSGLPFVSSNQSNPRQVQSLVPALDSSTENRSGESAVQWFNPHTNNVLHIDPRTGMVVPTSQSDQPLRSNTPMSQQASFSRTIDDVTSTLKGYFPFPQVEEALKSVTTNYDSHDRSHRFEDSGHARILNSGTPLHISGPSKVEPIELNITKDDLKTAKILGQVDKKFILASIVSGQHHTKMILIDQHAADERVKVEELYQSLCDDMVVTLPSPIAFEVNQQDMQRFKYSQNYLATCGIYYSTATNQVKVSALPKLVAERCRLEPKLLIDLLRVEIWKEILPLKSRNKNGDWLLQISAFPQGVLDMLVSRACRSAIMFNDSLTLQDCQDLVQRLSACSFPFQCAHGRPSMTIIARIQEARAENDYENRDSTFGQSWKAWT